MRQGLARMRERFQELPEDWQRWAVTGAFMLLSMVLWVAVLEIFWYGNHSITDTPIYYSYAGRIVSGMFPYRDFAMEYPPVAMLLMLLPRLVSGPGYVAFVVWFQAEMLVTNLGIVMLMASLAWRQWHSIRRLALTLALYTIFILALGSIVKTRFDMAVGFIILASLVAYVTDRRLLAWILLGVGLMTKVMPVVIAPLFLIIHFRRRQYQEMWLGPLAMLLTALIIAIPFLLTSWQGLVMAFTYHLERPLQLESSWASPLLLLHNLGGLDLRIMNSYGSHNVFSAGSGVLAQASAPVTAVALLVGYYIFYRSTSSEMSPAQWHGRLIWFASLEVAVFIAGGKVFSPQFLIWLLPLIPLVTGRGRRLVLVMFSLVLVLTQVEFPSHYWALYSLDTYMIAIVAARNLMLLAMVAVMMAEGWRSGRYP